MEHITSLLEAIINVIQLVKMAKSLIISDNLSELSVSMQKLDGEKNRIINIVGSTTALEVKRWLDRVASVEESTALIVDWRKIAEAAQANPDSRIQDIIKEQQPRRFYRWYYDNGKAFWILKEASKLIESLPREASSTRDDAKMIEPVTNQDQNCHPSTTVVTREAGSGGSSSTAMGQVNQDVVPGTTIGIMNKATNITQTTYMYFGERTAHKRR